MSLTNPTIHVPDNRVSIPSWVRHHLSWMLVALAVLAAVAVLAVTLIDSDSGTDTAPVTQTFDADRGSISAIEHRTAPPAASSAGGSLDHESISAVDHRLATRGG